MSINFDDRLGLQERPITTIRPVPTLPARAILGKEFKWLLMVIIACCLSPIVSIGVPIVSTRVKAA